MCQHLQTVLFTIRKDIYRGFSLRNLSRCDLDYDPVPNKRKLIVERRTLERERDKG